MSSPSVSTTTALIALHLGATLLSNPPGIVAHSVAELTNISLARGAPSLDIVAVDDLRASADRAFERDPAGMCAYGTSPGYTRLPSTGSAMSAASRRISVSCSKELYTSRHGKQPRAFMR